MDIIDSNENLSNLSTNLQEILSSLQKDPHSPLLILLQNFLNLALAYERNLFLEKSKQPNKANGFYKRSIQTPIGVITSNVPRDRLSLFNSALLPPPYKRTYPDEYNNFLLSLILNSYSPNAIKSILYSLNLPFSYEYISELKEAIIKAASEINTRPIPNNIFALFIDAYHGTDNGLVKDPSTGKIIRATIYLVISIATNGTKDLIAFFVESGTENKSMWLSIFNKLRDRGLTKPLLFVSDDFPGLKEAIKEIFPLSDHQICLVHLERNIRRNMHKNEANEVISEIQKLKYENDYDFAVSRFEQVVKRYQEKYPSFIKSVLSKKENYFIFIKYPQQVRRHIYTTNIVENFNSLIEIERREKGGYFATSKTAECVIYLIYQRLKQGKWSKPIPTIIGAEYELNQMFNLRFSYQTHNS